MVVPVVSESGPAVNLSEIKRFVGNNSQLMFDQNRCTILVIGNNVSLKIGQNFGVVKVVGNNCAVNIAECKGTVEYTGNNGRISLEGEVGSDKVTYVGCNGSLISKKAKGEKSTRKKSSSQVIVDHAILVQNNIRIKNPCIKVNLEDFNKFLPYTVWTA